MSAAMATPMIAWIGWDIGGAHLKAAALAGDGQLIDVAQVPMPLWQGLEQLDQALATILARWPEAPSARHALTMTGELVDGFASREIGVGQIVDAASRILGRPNCWLFAGAEGFIAAPEFQIAQAPKIASANWLASGQWAAKHCGEALFIDVGSTTSDVLLIAGHEVRTQGYSDFERMSQDELIYTGVVRTSLMAVADRVPFRGEWVRPMAEHFATTADIYRITGELPAHADQFPSADGGPKSVTGSQVRLARCVGCDASEADSLAWHQLATWFRERQIDTLQAGVARQLSRHQIGHGAPIIGAGIGRFLVQTIASRLARPYTDFDDFFAASADRRPDFGAADCAPAAAVACLAARRLDRK